MKDWIPGAPTEPGYYWIATKIYEDRRLYGGSLKAGDYWIRMARFERLDNGRLYYTAEDSTWESKRTMESVQFHIRCPQPEPPDENPVS